ncbi:MAG: PEP-CTERM sorting domain-containing protein, partial [Chthoniobacterales bacterium]
VWEWNESAFDGSNSLSSEFRAVRGGGWDDAEGGLRSSGRIFFDPSNEINFLGFRVASSDVEPIPEPGTWAAMVLLAAGGALRLARARRRG